MISPDAVSTRTAHALNRYWPVRARGRGRLYAFGFDAYRIVPLLKAGKFGSEHAVPGMTGLLSIDEKGRVRRELDWARVSGGKPTAAGSGNDRIDAVATVRHRRAGLSLRRRSRSWTIAHARKRAVSAEQLALATCRLHGLRLIARNFVAAAARSIWSCWSGPRWC